jgi:type II secretory pathway predicted ATPase ExeA
MALVLKRVLAEAGISNRVLGQALGISGAAVNAIVNRNHWPKTPGKEALQTAIAGALAAQTPPISARGVFKEEKTAAEGGTPQRPLPQRGEKPQHTEGDTMLLAKQGLSPQARKHFGLNRDPFNDDIESGEDVFKTGDIRMVREHMLQTAQGGGFLAVIGESGSGKSTLADDIEDSLLQEGAPVVLIRPYVIGMEGDDAKGKRLKAGAILDAVIRAVDPQSARPAALQPKAERAHEALKASATSGRRHCLVIDEAHRLAVPTLKHLKGFYELKLGHKKLLSIILIGQPELAGRLDPRNPELREVTQRCELRELPPLDEALEDYLAFKLKRVGKPWTEVFDIGAVAAVREKLTYRRGKAEAISLVYPLAVGNLVTAALNQAAALGAPKVTADVVEVV